MENLELCPNTTILNVLRLDKFNANGWFKATRTLGNCSLAIHHLLRCCGEKSYTIWKNASSSKMLVSLTVVEKNPGCWESALSTVRLQEWSMDGFQSRPSSFPIPVPVVAGMAIASRPFFYAVLSNLRNFLMMGHSLPHFLGMHIPSLWMEMTCVS